MAIITDLEHYKGRINGPCSACGDGDTAMEYHDHEPPAPSYTLAEIEALARKYVDTLPPLARKLTTELAISGLLAWLARREKEEAVK